MEHCSACGGQRLQCRCRAHDPRFARWSGWCPGSLEADALGIDLNDFHSRGLAQTLLIKPPPRGRR